MPQSLKSIASINVGVNNVQSITTGISVTGDIGVGTSTPLQDVNSGPVIEIKGTTTDRIGGLILRSSNNSVDARFRAFNDQVFIGAESANDLILRTNGADRMIITSTGNIEITPTPTAASHATRKDYVDSTSAAFAIALGI